MTSTTAEKSSKKKRQISNVVQRAENYFIAGVVNLTFSAWLLGAYPHWYWVYHSVKNFFLMVHQLFRRKNEGQGKHYYQFEFCFTVNYWICVYFFVCLLKKNVGAMQFLRDITDSWGYVLFRVAFAWANGPLALSIIQQRNGFIFHSLDQMTILAVHIGPPLVTYTMRWYNERLETSFPDTFHIDVNRAADSSDMLRTLFLWPSILYITLWSIPYLFVMYTVYGHMKRKGYETMVESLERSPPIKSVLHLLGSKHNITMYIVLHGVICCTTFLLSQLFWRSFWAHTLYLVGLFLVAVRNSSTFYFEKLIPESESEKAIYPAGRPSRQNDKLQTGSDKLH